MTKASPPYQQETFSHVGIIVKDLDSAVRRYGETLDLSFTDPILREPVMIAADGSDISRPFRLAYGLDGPPYYELLEMQVEGGYYGPHNGEGIHHIGLWADGVEAVAEGLRTRGVEPEVTLHRRESGGITAIYFAPGTLEGTRIELVDAGLRATFFEQLTDPEGIR